MRMHGLTRARHPCGQCRGARHRPRRLRGSARYPSPARRQAGRINSAGKIMTSATSQALTLRRKPRTAFFHRPNLVFVDSLHDCAFTSWVSRFCGFVAEGTMRVVVDCYCGVADTWVLRRSGSLPRRNRRARLAHRACRAHAISPCTGDSAPAVARQANQTRLARLPIPAPVIKVSQNGAAQPAAPPARPPSSLLPRIAATARRAGRAAHAAPPRAPAPRLAHDACLQCNNPDALGISRVVADRHHGRSGIRHRAFQAIRFPARQGSRADLR